MYDAVIFDLFGTLVEDVYISIYQQMAERLGLDESVFQQNWTKGYIARTTGKTHFRESLHFLCQEFGLTVSPDLIRDITDIRVGSVRRSLQSVRPGAAEILSSLSKAGVPTDLLSNAALEVVDVWPSFPLAAQFDATVFSCTAGMMKPNPEFYQLICGKLSVRPECCLYVGDGGDQELAGAALVGMTPVQVQSARSPVPKARFSIASFSELLTILKTTSPIS